MSALLLQFPQRLGPRRQKRYARNRKPCSITDIHHQPNQQSPKQPGQTREQQAYALYLEASRIDETPEHYSRADSLYRQAIDLAPDSSTAAIAWTNLGNVRFRMRDTEAAEHCYHRALTLSPAQPEALYNSAHIIPEPKQSTCLSAA
jgi:Tfp pilus assembly protein PilF